MSFIGFSTPTSTKRKEKKNGNKNDQNILDASKLLFVGSLLKNALKKFSQIKERTKKIPDKTKIHPLPISNIGAIKLLSSSNSSSPF